MQTIYDDDALVQRLTEEVVAKGHRILQIYKLGPTDKEHIAALLRLFDPPRKARVLDGGCGVGEVSRLMKEARPDLTFTLLNRSEAQLAMCPEGMPRLQGMLEATPAADASFDAVMVNYALGHTNLGKALAEASRVLRRDGVLFVYDMVAFPNVDCLVAPLNYQLYHPSAIISAARQRDFMLTEMELPKGDATDFKSVIGATDFDRIFAANNVQPVAYRFVKC
jgi:ubiquinone/menaquinone biosynthesis C-methylase UbiE